MLNTQQKFDEILNWLKSVPQPDILSRSELEQLILQLMRHTIFVFLYVVSLNPSSKKKFVGYSKHRAIVIGNMVRISKHYEGFLIHMEKRQYELAGIFIRLIYETDVTIDYFLNSKQKQKTFRNYIFTSYKTIKSQLIELFDLSQRRGLTAIENRMKTNMIALLKSDRITKKELLMNKNWRLDGKNFKDLLRHLKREDEYASIFGNASSFVHGSWHEINSFHLTKNGGHYLPKLEYSIVDLRISVFVTYICLNRLLVYIKWNKLQIEDKRQTILTALWDLTGKISQLGTA